MLFSGEEVERDYTRLIYFCSKLSLTLFFARILNPEKIKQVYEETHIFIYCGSEGRFPDGIESCCNI